MHGPVYSRFPVLRHFGVFLHALVVFPDVVILLSFIVLCDELSEKVQVLLAFNIAGKTLADAVSAASVAALGKALGDLRKKGRVGLSINVRAVSVSKGV